MLNKEMFQLDRMNKLSRSIVMWCLYLICKRKVEFSLRKDLII